MNQFIEQGFLDAGVITVNSGGGGNTAVSLQPPENEAWLILWAVAYNEEGGKAQYWQIKGCVATDPVTITESTPAAMARVALYGDYGVTLNFNPWAIPLRLTNDHYAIAYANLAADKDIMIAYVAYKIRAWGTPQNE